MGEALNRRKRNPVSPVIQRELIRQTHDEMTPPAVRL
jgi:hypothetical protein